MDSGRASQGRKYGPTRARFNPKGCAKKGAPRERETSQPLGEVLP
jgi:hypothetical protein